MASAAAKVGSSRCLAAGVPVLDLERLVDFPKEPVSATARRGFTTAGFPSSLFSEESGNFSGKLGGGIAVEIKPYLEYNP